MLFDVGLRGMMFLFSNQSLLPRNVDWGQNLVLELVIHCGLALMVNRVCHILSSIVKLNELTGEIMWAKREWDAKILCQPVCYCQRCIHGWKVPCHMQPEDWVLNKNHRCHRWKQRRVQGPFQVLLTAETAVKVAQKVPWIHASHFKNFSEPYDDFSPAGPNLSSPPNENEGWSVCFLRI